MTMEQSRSISARMPQYLDALGELVSIAGISAEGVDSPELARSAEACVELAKASGHFDEVKVLKLDGAGPAVWAERIVSDTAPTVLLYAHHDVQPTGDLSQWHTDPWKATEVDGRLYGRGTADDKAGLLVHLAALDQLDADLNVRMLLEGDEEIGSPRLAQLLEEHGELLRADVVLAPDAVNHDVDVPSLTVGLRGLLDVEIGVRCLSGPIHSGIFGGSVPDAIGCLLHLLASIADPDGQSRIRGLVTSDLGAAAAPDVESWRASTGALSGLKLPHDGRDIVHRSAGSASVAVLGLDVPSIADSSAVLHAQAKARVLVRLAPEQDPGEALTALQLHLDAQDVLGAEVSLHQRNSAVGTYLDANASIGTLALEALSEGFGNPAVAMAVGGSIPFTAAYGNAFGEAALLITALQDPQTRAHGWNESLSLGGFLSAMTSEALMLNRIAALDLTIVTS